VTKCIAGAKEIAIETRQDQRQRALDRMAARKWPLPKGYRFDRDEANER
jgi:antitoxin MazE